jgi:serine protease AprX
MKLERQQIEELIFRTRGMRRFVQESPILPDVWFGYAEDPLQKKDLLLTPYGAVSSGELSQRVRARTVEERKKTIWKNRHGDSEKPALVIYNQSTVLASLWFDELIRVVLPLSDWWIKHVIKQKDKDFLKNLRGLSKHEDLGKKLFSTEPLPISAEILWIALLIGTIEVSRRAQLKKGEAGANQRAGRKRPASRPDLKLILNAAAELMDDIVPESTNKPQVYSVNLNRKAEPALTRSLPTIKADAAHRLFSLSCKDLKWAVIDSGIDAQHKGFRQYKKDGNSFSMPEKAFIQEDGIWKNHTRVLAAYDFTLIRHVLNPEGAEAEDIPEALRKKLEERPGLIQEIRLGLNNGREVDWGLLLPFLEIPLQEPYKPPVHDHGTHVAGILAADWPKEDPENPEQEDIRGVCPDLSLYDLRVLDDQGVGDEFTVMAALQFVRYLNSHKDCVFLHGVNLSLSIRHEVKNYACGRTPVCEECERLVGAGIVVVSAAGNRGYLQYQTEDGFEEGYRSISITDPGNAEGVITVGATHAFLPHQYGVSYFSSRGPTGDGRLKPDLVAPGEKIKSLVPGQGLKVFDGTSMAAPHVSGAAALLIARHGELAGQPFKVKKILCETATDLGRERYFQGAGLVDILRAIQSV